MAILQKKLTLKNKKKSKGFQKKLCLLMSAMLENGFSFQETFAFLAKLPHEEGWFGKTLITEIQQGNPLHLGFQKAYFSKEMCFQIQLVEVHGDFSGTLKSMAYILKVQQEQQKMLRKVVAYPSLLLVFLLGLLLSLKYLLLPQLEGMGSYQENTLLLTMTNIPFYLLIGLGVLGVIFLGVQVFFKKQSPLKKATFLGKIPFFGKIYITYLTAFFSGELGKLFHFGVDLKETFEMLATQTTHPFLQAIGKQSLILGAEGKELTGIFQEKAFFLPEFSYMIQTGEKKGNLSQELLFYSEILYGDLVSKIQKALKFVQPILFLGIALFIVTLYASLLLPLYQQNWEVYS